MARILYGVAGEGMGHAMRSLAIIEHLGKKHRIKVVSASRSFAVLSKRFDCEEIDYFKIIYRNNTAANILTVLNNMVRFPLIFFKGLKVGRIIDSFKPDVILTDFEPIVDYYAAMRGIPVISIDNQHIISEASHGRVDQGHAVDKFITSCIIKTFVIKANKKIITTFFEPALKKGSNAILVAPILRKEIAKLKPRVGKHVLVYQTSTSNTALLDVLRQLPHSFVVYGLVRKKNKDILNSKTQKTSKNFSRILHRARQSSPTEDLH